MLAYQEINKCRISGSTNLITVLSLGEQYLTGVFPKSKDEVITKGPIDLVWCPESGLLQLKQSYSVEEMYGDNYGYRSGLNASMVRHLQHKAHTLMRMYPMAAGDVVLDIGSNDATLLHAYPSHLKRIGMDPTGKKFSQFYTDGIELIPDFFSARQFAQTFPNLRPKLITSIAMFYDVEKPLEFVAEIEQILDDEGIWHFEQSYMPSMLRTNSYDTICHEHLEFYSFEVVKNILEKCDMKVIDVQMNSINGGSFAVTAAKKHAKFKPNYPVINWLLQEEYEMGLKTPKPFRDFEERVFRHRNSLMNLINSLVVDGKKILGYGASTKGNVLLQFCNITDKHIPAIADINPDKYGCFTPGTNIPIISESEAKAMQPDYFLVLPWHFKHSILQREQEYIANGGKFIFPLPEIEIV
ncbi:MAG: class I SAM-dependent methyltransferase [Bacteroidia bacterium]|nr:class I SAM-dependent methyltransferase [Bacteroidia bacterium]